ncbi:MAG: SPO1 DNA polymerase [Nitrosomonadales bacterium]|nr:MAG: SPO1 DNA polymerase [Nitrosomonadales bacterium]
MSLSSCRQCPRLASFLDAVKAENPAYHARPVLPFGDEKPRLLIVGLAPGMHGANRTGRPFTGDHAGILLYQTLHRFGFASGPESVSAGDGLKLLGCRITNAVKCLPPQNKPETAEIRQCNAFLREELAALPRGTAVLALGNVAHQAALWAQGLKIRDYPFAHAARYDLPSGLALYDSYHCSRYNTQTRRLTAGMFEAVFADVRNHLDGASPCPTSTSASPAA